MTTRFALPDDAWADLREATKIPERLRRPITRAGLELNHLVPDSIRPTVEGTDADPAVPSELKVEEITGDMWAAAQAVDDVTIIAFVEAWSFGDVTLAVLGDLPGDVFDALLAECRRLNEKKVDTESPAIEAAAPA